MGGVTIRGIGMEIWFVQGGLHGGAGNVGIRCGCEEGGGRLGSDGRGVRVC